MSAGVAVIVPMYNTEQHFSDLVTSLASQDYCGRKLAVFVDDGSPDGCAAMAARGIEGWESVVLSKEHGGQSSARNAALDWLGAHADDTAADIEYVMFVDSDDKLAEDALSSTISPASMLQLDELFFTGTSFFETPELEERFSNYKNFYDRAGGYDGVCTGPEYMATACANDGFFSSPCMQLLSLPFLRRAGIRFHEDIIYEDNLFTYTCLVRAQRVAYLNRRLYLRRIRENSTMTSPVSAENVLGYYRCAERALAASDELSGLSASKRAAFANVLDAWISGATDHWQTISESERTRVLELLEPSDLLLFHQLVVRRAAERIAREAAVADARSQATREANRAFEEKLAHSPSFRLGRALTAIPRKFMGR